MSNQHGTSTPLLSNLTRPVSDMSSIQESTVLIPLNLDPHLSLPTVSKIRRKRVNQNNSKYKQDLLNDLTNFGFNMDSVSTPPPEELAPNMDANYSSINNNQRNAEILKLKKTIVSLRQNLGESNNKLQSQTIKNEKLISELKTLRGQISKRKKESVKLLKAKDTLLKEKINLRTELREIRQFLDEQSKQTCQATTLNEESVSSDEEGVWEYAHRNRKNKRRCRPVMYSSSTSSDASSISSSNSSSSSSGSNNITDSSSVSRSHSGSDSRRSSRPKTSNHQKNERPQRRSMITENQPDNSHDSTTTANNRRDKCTKKRCDNSDNKKETQLPDATTMQDRTMKNKCVIGDSNMRGLATQLKSKLTNPESVCVYKTSGMKIAHLTTRLPGYVNEDTEAVIIHLGTNDIGDQANKAMQDINELTKQMTALHNTHFYFSEIPPRSQNKYNTLIHRVNSHIRDICSKLKNVDYMPTPVTKQHLSRGGIHLNDKGQQKLTAAMAEVFNNHAATGQSFHIPTIITRT